jgi:two-component system, LytTR family, response regulator
MEQKISALIVDDEEGARKLLRKLLEESLYFNDIRVAQSVTAADNVMNQFEPDLIFLDIKMPGKDGFSLIPDLATKTKKPEIVFVTAYEQYALKAIKNQAFDYLLKPVNRKELNQCIIRFLDWKNKSLFSSRVGENVETYEKITRIRVNSRTETFFINPATILFCKADGNYTTICTGAKHQLCSLNLGKVEELLPGNGFVRVGRSHIINFEYITTLDRKESTITMVKNGESVKIKIPRQNLKVFDKISL